MSRKDTRNDRILFVDLELTCWDGPPPEGQRPEIIEIGVAEVDNKALEIVRSQSFIVRPIWSEISEYCAHLTGIRSKDVKGRGMHLGDACNILRKKWGSANKTWMAWGEDDAALIRDCGLKEVEMPFSHSFMNLSKMYTLMTGDDRRRNLYDTMDSMGVEYGGRAHSGVDDATNTALLYIGLMTRIRENGLVVEKTPAMSLG